MKAILEFELPNSCSKCILRDDEHLILNTPSSGMTMLHKLPFIMKMLENHCPSNIIIDPQDNISENTLNESGMAAAARREWREMMAAPNRSDMIIIDPEIDYRDKM